eukprot:TRINITY_DN37328_c0_g1_i1.p1 TRINITY_DN37328_c0_g1~~TRINITY_DN37328_c0_g1_i1.p1  ORF type:complete len:473 (+),score=74.10 TRINITY_DN37328_c0_g1_i1:194-1420(+)
MQELFDMTWVAKYSRDRKLDGDTRVPTGGQVTEVLRVENHKMFKKYLECKERLQQRRPDGCEAFSVATSTHPQCHVLDTSLNEMYLCHGTVPSAAQAIATKDFDLSRSGSAVGTMLGPGLYMAENASKSDEYAREGCGMFAGLSAMLICRALAGKVRTVLDKGDFSECVKSGEFDSICGDRAAAVGTFREMVFFDSSAVYCEFIVLYKRLYADTGPETKGTSKQDDAREACWQLQLGGEWKDFSRDESILLEQAFQAGGTRIKFRSRGNDYECNLGQKVQRNVKTGREREIRRVGGAPPAHDEVGIAADAETKLKLGHDDFRKWMHDDVLDASVSYVLPQYPKATAVDLSQTKISDSALQKVAKVLSNLESLNVAQCNGISVSGVERVCESCPQLRHLLDPTFWQIPC